MASGEKDGELYLYRKKIKTKSTTRKIKMIDVATVLTLRFLIALSGLRLTTQCGPLLYSEELHVMRS